MSDCIFNTAPHLATELIPKFAANGEGLCLFANILRD